MLAKISFFYMRNAANTAVTAVTVFFFQFVESYERLFITFWELQDIEMWNAGKGHLNRFIVSFKHIPVIIKKALETRTNYSSCLVNMSSLKKKSSGKQISLGKI